jgi:hypothetical protein
MKKIQSDAWVRGEATVFCLLRITDIKTTHCVEKSAHGFLLG